MPRVRIVFLGTSGAIPTKERNHPAVYLEYFGHRMLFDCGEGTQRQMFRFGVSPSKINYVFISHIHGDHFFGVPGLLNTMALLERTTPLKIFVPRTQQREAVSIINKLVKYLPFDVDVVPVTEGEAVREKDFTVSAFRLDHTAECYGYVFAERERIKADKDKLRELGIFNSPLVGRLKRGETVTVNGKEVKPEDVLYTEKGIKVVYVADTRPVVHETMEGADVLVHESAFMHADIELAEEKKHCTAKEAAEVAKSVGARRLFLFHVSGRYKDVNEVVKEARVLFPETHVPSDGEELFL